MRRMPTATRDPKTIGADLERRRLQHRARRIEHVIVVLRERRALGIQSGSRPAALDQAIAGFGAELASVRERLVRMV
jgi:hypothetical protein